MDIFYPQTVFIFTPLILQKLFSYYFTFYTFAGAASSLENSSERCITLISSFFASNYLLAESQTLSRNGGSAVAVVEGEGIATGGGAVTTTTAIGGAWRGNGGCWSPR